MPRPARSSGDDRPTWADAAETARGSRSRPPAPRFQAPVCLLPAGRARLPPQLRALEPARNRVDAGRCTVLVFRPYFGDPDLFPEALSVELCSKTPCMAERAAGTAALSARRDYRPLVALAGERGLLCLRIEMPEFLRARHRSVAEVPDDEAAPDVGLVDEAVVPIARPV